MDPLSWCLFSAIGEGKGEPRGMKDVDVWGRSECRTRSPCRRVGSRARRLGGGSWEEGKK